MIKFPWVWSCRHVVVSFPGRRSAAGRECIPSCARGEDMSGFIGPSGAGTAEARAFLAAHPEIEAIDILLHDSNGIGRGKIIRRHELMAVFEAGRHLPISILGLDIRGEDVHETGLIWATGDADVRAWPVPGSL